MNAAWPLNAEQPPDQPATRNGFFEALSKAQGEFQPIRRDKTVTVRTKAGGTYSFSYAPLEAILRATLPALNKHGFSLVQHVEEDFLVTTLYHGDGRLSGSVKIMVVDNGPQAYGSALTYARRYGVTLLLGICADDDDDGNAAEGNTITEARQRAGSSLPNGDGPNNLPNITPHGEEKYHDQAKAQAMAEKCREAMRVGLDEAVWELHDECNKDSVFYIAVSAYLSPAERREWKEIVKRRTAHA